MTMNDERPDPYELVIADLERQRETIDAAIKAIRDVAGRASDAGWSVTASRPETKSGAAMRDDEFFGMSIAKAAKKYLAIVKKPTPAPVIARELKKHGLLNTAKGFPNTVYSILYRDSLKPNGTAIRVGNAWGLAEWYPNRPRGQKGKAAPIAQNGTVDATDDGSGESAPVS